MKKILFSLIWLICSGYVLIAQEPLKEFENIQSALFNTNSNVVMIAAHRGAHLLYPENSIPSVIEAIRLGIDVAELDIRFTKDRKMVIMHDKTVDRTTTGKGLVSDYTFDDIRKLKLRIKDSVTNEIVPTLEEVFMLAKDKILIDLDIKEYGCIDSIIPLVNRMGMEKNCIFFVYLPAYAKMIKDLDHELISMVRTGKTSDVPDVFKIVKTEVVHIDPSHYNDTVINECKSNGSRIWINALGAVDKKVAAGDINAFEEVIKYGANMIQTDQPALLKGFLESRNLYHKKLVQK